MRNVTVAAIQMSIPETPEKSVEKAEKLVRKAAAEGANVILLPELFENWYFCQERRYDSYKLALPLEENPAVRRFQTVAKELSVVLPISFYEQDGNVLYNSVAMIDADGSVMGVYRKTHIPDDHFYQEKFYFTPGDTGFKVWDTRFGKIGVGICWDQWFPEAARSMALLGAELLPGTELVLDTIGFSRLLDGADLVVTGEGRIDLQTTAGKAPAGIAAAARKKGIPVIAIAGSVEHAAGPGETGLEACFCVLPSVQTLEEAMDADVARVNVTQCVTQIFRLLKLARERIP